MKKLFVHFFARPKKRTKEKSPLAFRALKGALAKHLIAGSP